MPTALSITCHNIAVTFSAGMDNAAIIIAYFYFQVLINITKRLQNKFA